MAERSVYVRLGAKVADYVRGMRTATAATERLKDKTQELDRSTRAAAGIRAYGVALSALPVAAAPAAALLAALPVAITAGGAAVAAVAPAFSGMGDAMEAAAVGGVELDAALRGLTPSAREIVGELDGLRSELGGLRGTLQESFWRQLTGDFDQLAGSTIPMLNHRLGALSGTFGRVAHNALEFVSEAEQVEQIDRILADTNRSMGRLNGIVEDGTGLWLDLAESGGVFLDGTLRSIAEFTAALRSMFAEMRASGELDRLFVGGADAIDGLLSALLRLLDALFTVFASPGVQAAVALLVDSIEGVTIAAQVLAEIFGVLPAPIQTVIAVMALLVGVAIPAAGAMLRLRASTQATLGQLALLGPTGAKAATGLGKLSSAVGKIGIVGAVIGLVIGLGQWLWSLTGAAEASDEQITKLAESLHRFAAGGRPTGDVISAIAGDVESLDRALTQMVASGQIGAAADAFARIKSIMQATGHSTKAINRDFAGYRAAAALAGEASHAMGGGFSAAEQQARILNTSMQEQINLGRTLMDVFNALNGAALAWIDAQIRAEEVVDNLTAAYRRNGNTLDPTNAKGRENLRITKALVVAAAEARQAKYDETRNVEAADKVWDRYIGTLVKTMKQANFTDKDIRKLLGSIAKTPLKKHTDISTTAKRESGRVNKLRRDIRSLKGKNVFIDLYVRRHGESKGHYSGPATGLLERHGGVVHAARHGMVTPAHVAVGTRIKWAEPATGGEAFIPRNGIASRSRAIVDEAASWYGGRVDWGGGQMSGPMAAAVPVHVTVDLVGRDGAVVQAVRRHVQVKGGGNVQIALGRS